MARSEGALLGAPSEHAAKAAQTVDRSRETGDGCGLVLLRKFRTLSKLRHDDPHSKCDPPWSSGSEHALKPPGAAGISSAPDQTIACAKTIGTDLPQ